MTGFRVFMKPGGWRVTDGLIEHGPYPTYGQAVSTRDNLNLQQRPQEARSFAPLDEEPGSIPVAQDLRVTRDESLEIPEMDAADREAIERARVGGTDSPAAGSASLGGGLV